MVSRNAPAAASSTTPLTVATAVSHDGGLHALKAHAVQPMTKEQARQVLGLLESAMPAGDERARIVGTVVRGLVEAMAEAAGLDAA